MDGIQLGDPDKVADAFLALVNSQNPALDLFLGSDAYQRAKSKLEQLTAEMELWKNVSFSTDFKS